MTAKTFPSNRCKRHPSVFLVDVIENTGAISRACPECVPLELVDVVRQVHRRRTA